MKYIELNVFLKVVGVATSGGEAKQIIRSGKVKVNNIVETRNRKKLVPGDKVTVDKEYLVTEEMAQMETKSD